MGQYAKYKSEFNIKWIILKNKWKKVILYAGKMWRIQLSIASEAEALIGEKYFWVICIKMGEFTWKSECNMLALKVWHGFYICLVDYLNLDSMTISII